MRWVLGLWLALWASVSFGQSLVTAPFGWSAVPLTNGASIVVSQATGATMMIPPGQLGAFGLGNGTGGVGLTFGGAARVGAGDAAMVLGKSLTFGLALKFASRALAWGPLIAPIATALYDQYRCRRKAGDLTLAECDLGQPQTAQAVNVYRTNLWPGSDSSSPLGSCQIWAPAYVAVYQTMLSSTQTVVVGSIGYDSAQGACQVNFVVSTPGYPDATTLSAPIVALIGTTAGVGCPLLPGNATIPTPGRDGKCPTGTWTPTSLDDAAGIVASDGAPGHDLDVADLPRTVKEALDRGVDGGTDVRNALDGQPGNLSGPAQTVDVGPTVTVNNNGVTTTTTSTTTNNITYGGSSTTTNNYTYNSVKSDTASTPATGTSPASTVTTTTNTTPAADPKTDCQLFPNIAGCQLLGVAPPAETIPSSDIPIAYVPTFFAGGSGCPAPFPLAFSIAGRAFSFSISNQPLCDLMSTLAPIFLALFAAAAALVFMDGMKTL